MYEKIKVMVVDDSASVRKIVSAIIDSNPDMEVIAAAPDPIIAERYLNKQRPDVIILDIEMPKKDGITFLKEIMADRPTPVIICSSLAEKNAAVTMEALFLGAVDIITKPKIGIKDFLDHSEAMITDAVRSAFSADLKKINPKPAPKLKASERLSADAILPSGISMKNIDHRDRFIAIGASAGGTRAIEVILKALPKDTLPIAIVQHMPEKFTKAYAERLNKICDITVKEAEDGDELKTGGAYIAPGNRHILVKRVQNKYFIETKDGPPVSRHKPSVDVLFRSVAREAGSNAVGIILTGMGDDGAAGMTEMRKSGVMTIAQDQETSLIFGMPNEAIKRGGAQAVLPLQKMPEVITAFNK